MRRDNGQWLSASAVVLANGIQAGELCPGLPIAPKGHLLITDRYPGKVQRTLVELGYVTSAHNASGPSVACNIQPRPTGQLFIGASRQFGTTDPQTWKAGCWRRCCAAPWITCRAWPTST